MIRKGNEDSVVILDRADTVGMKGKRSPKNTTWHRKGETERKKRTMEIGESPR